MVSCVPGAIVAIARKCKPLEPSEAVCRTTTQLASPGGARFFTNSLPTYVWKRVKRKVQVRLTLPDGRIVTKRSRRTGSRSIKALPPTLPPAISTCAPRRVESE